jgi:hypothetical protein
LFNYFKFQTWANLTLFTLHLFKEQIPVEFIFTCQAKDVDLLCKDLLELHFRSVFGVQLIFHSIEDDSVNYYQIRLQGNRQCLKRLLEAVKHFCRLLRTHSVNIWLTVIYHLHYFNL